jgi:PAS domain S-box-containing protein
VRAEEILALEKRRIAYILQGTNVGAWEWNVQTGETTLNERWAEIIGCTLEEISPVSIDTWMKFTHPDDLKVLVELLEKHFNGELDYYECEARMRHKNGDWVWVLDRGQVATWTEDGKPLLMSGTHLDITDRKQAENKLKESEERFRMFFEQAGDAVFVHNLEEQYVEVNERACSSLGYSKDELMAISAADIEVGREPKNLHELWEDLEANKVITTTGEQRRKDGSTFPVEVRLRSIQRDDQRLMMVMARDITVRKQLEEALRREKYFTQNLIDTAQAILLVLDTEGRIVRFNPFMEDLCGYKLDEVRGMDWFSTFLPEQNRNRIKEVFRTAVTGNETRGNINPIVAKDGREIIVEWYDKTLKDADGNTIGLLTIGQDITSRKRAEEALKNAHNELEQRVKERTAELQESNRFTSGIEPRIPESL